MKFEGKADIVKKSIRFLASNLEPDDRIALVSFDTKARVDLPLSAIKDIPQDKINAVVDNLLPGLATNISDAMILCNPPPLSLLPAQLHLALRQLRDREGEAVSLRAAAIILITDGCPTDGIIKPTDMVAALDRVLGQLPNLSIYTFGIGRDVDSNLLRSIAVREPGWGKGGGGCATFSWRMPRHNPAARCARVVLLFKRAKRHPRRVCGLPWLAGVDCRRGHVRLH
jgi:uncharacterized protein YegL